MIFRRKKKDLDSLIPYEGKIEVFSRHCIFSSISQHKKRIPYFSHEKCYQNLLNTLDAKQANLTLFLDQAKGSIEEHYLKGVKTISLNEGTEAGSFLRILEYVENLKLHPETIVYFVEDDYLHLPGFLSVLKEGFTIPNVHYVTLYDHRDKYFFSMYEKLQSRIFVTSSTHWRTIPSTTQTFAVKYQTLMEDISIHRKYSLHRKITQDHEKFLHLQRKKRVLISSIPGWSTHVEEAFASPLINWESLLQEMEK